MTYNVEVFQDKSGEWRWRRKALNGKIIADSGEGYKNRSYGVEAAIRENPDALNIKIDAPTKDKPTKD